MKIQRRNPDNKQSTANSKTAKKPAAQPKKDVQPDIEPEEKPRGDRLFHVVFPYILFIIGVFFAVCFISIDIFGADENEGVGLIGGFLRNFFCGVFGATAFSLPAVLIYLAIVWRKAVNENRMVFKIISAVIVLMSISALVSIYTDGGSFDVRYSYNGGVSLTGGGFLGGMFGFVCCKLVGPIGSPIILGSLIAVFSLFFVGLTPKYVITCIKYKMHEKKMRLAEERAAGEQYEDDDADADESNNRKDRKAELKGKEKDKAKSKAPNANGNSAGDESKDDNRSNDSKDDYPKKKKRREAERNRNDEDNDDRADDNDNGNDTKYGDNRNKRGEAIRDKHKKRHESVADSKYEDEDEDNSNDKNDDTDGKASDSGYGEPQESVYRKSTIIGADSDDDNSDVTSAQTNESADISQKEDTNDTKTTGKSERRKFTDDKSYYYGPEDILNALRDEADNNGEAATTAEGEILVKDTSVKDSTRQSATPVRVTVRGTATDGNGSPTYNPDDIPISDLEFDSETLSALEEISASDDKLEVSVAQTVAPYEFPSLELLNYDPQDDKDADINDEIARNTENLKETLLSFNIRIRDIAFSRGPTITRYEIRPEAGIKIRSIANLIDDIAMNLATTGVRIEAPIPNKAAVGIEVPNKIRRNVYLRELIDTEKFKNESSRLTACLGKDVGGNPIFFNIVKMPHLLIAGATGMGKSVCINSIIVSLLYKARPDEVKLILIDPKKVEFNIYKEIPHLYAPIVSNPKKAAGALASAVSEMERRFELIESVGVRDIGNYNKVTANDPEMEFMPQMVIIIDELADLMMTAKDEVETSICRLAQKARAAGIHLIIGTQRPSVDVITGLIKANVPSRIAFTVASQVDSRTIIDIAGAEKLIGMGDMLFSPVGISKPLRVQGAFVSENEVEAIVDFIKTKNSTAEYNDDFIQKIEEEAAKCGLGKKGAAAVTADSSDGEHGEGSKLREAIEVALENNKISTSLLQRKCKIGYGRAASIIDRMEELGFVGPADGNKPRNILLTRQMYMEMVLNGEFDGLE